MVKKFIRIPKKNSAFVYAIFESLEGMVSYSTLTPKGGASGQCDLMLLIPEGMEADLQTILEGFRTKFSVIELDQAPSA